MKTIKLKCMNCGKSFDRLLKEYKRNKKVGRKIFCSISCQIIYKNKQRTPEFCREKFYDISKHCGCRKDEYSPFRSFLRKSKGTFKKHSIKIDVEYLKEVWEKQKGICPYTGIKMILPKTTSESDKIRSLKAASLDRVDSSKGYIKNNIEFVCRAINLAKNNYSRQEMIEFLKEIDISITR